MATWLQNNTILTNAGLSLLSKAQVGLGKLSITKVVTRDVTGTIEQNRLLTGDSEHLSDGVAYKQSAVLLKPPGQGDAETPVDPNTGETENVGVSKITARFSNEQINFEYRIKQVIVFMRLIDLDPDAPEGTDVGEVPYMIAQTLGADDYDKMPLFTENPTAINYDLYILHSGVAQIDIAVKTAGYVDEDTFNTTIQKITTNITKIQNNLVGENTDGMTFDVWTPVYSEDDNPNGGREWSKSETTVQKTGTKSAERFNVYEKNENISVGSNSHTEGSDNVSLEASSHVEGADNYVGGGSWATHIEGNRNTAVTGWHQHIEGSLNYSTGYVNHIEGSKNKALSGSSHIEGVWNTSLEGQNVHIEGDHNTNTSGSNNHIGGYNNKIESGDRNTVSGEDNTLASSISTSVSGRKNICRNSSYSNISGNENVVVDSIETSVSGYKNVVQVSQGSVVNGNNNVVNDAPKSTVFGGSNTVSQDSSECLIGGYSNTNTYSKRTLMAGDDNEIAENSVNSIVSGYSNRCLSSGKNNLITGESNEVKETSIDNIVSGESHIVNDKSKGNIVSGYNNSVTRAFESIVSGYSNNVMRDASSEDTVGIRYTVLSGQNNEVSATKNSFISGYNNNIEMFNFGSIPTPVEPQNSVVVGQNNTLKGIYSSLVAGFENSIDNIHDSVIAGQHNVLSSEVAGTNTNCVLCTGLYCTVENDGTPMVALGNHCEVSGSNSVAQNLGTIAQGDNQTVLGKYNIADTLDKYAVIVGGGLDANNRKNILELDWGGNLHVKGIYTSNIYNPDGSQVLNAWNISNGTGQGSLVANNLNANHATGLYSTAIGNGTNATDNYAFAGGNNSKATADSAIALGDNCESSDNYTFTTGFQSKAKSGASQCVGHNSSVGTNCYAAFVSGYENKAEVNAFASFTTGQNNANQGSRSSILGGFQNKITGSNVEDSATVGNNNTVTGSKSFVCGTTNTVSGDTAFVTGSGNTVAGSYIVGGNQNNLTAPAVGTIVSGDSNIVNGTDLASNNVVSGYSNSLKRVQNSIVSGVRNGIDGTNIAILNGNIVSGNSNYLYCNDSIVSGYANRVAGCRNIVSGYDNTVGNYSSRTAQTTENHGIACIVSGNGNECGGVGNLMIGQHLTTKPSLGNITDSSSYKVFFGTGNDNASTVLNRNALTVGGGGFDSGSKYNLFGIAETTGNVYAKGTYNTEGADFAEWFEWEDSNVLKEDRRGLFVTLSGDKVSLADGTTKYVFGIVSARPSHVGNAYEDNWNKKFLTDIFGEILYEDYLIEAVKETVINPETGEEKEIIVSPEILSKRPVLNPDYNPDEGYVPRSKRPEWSCIACTGRLVAIDDGTCIPNGHCRPTVGGIATNSETGFRVLKRLDETHILVWTEGTVTF